MSRFGPCYRRSRALAGYSPITWLHLEASCSLIRSSSEIGRENSLSGNSRPDPNDKVEEAKITNDNSNAQHFDWMTDEVTQLVPNAQAGRL